jgi:N-carbamoylputrescine amidase
MLVTADDGILAERAFRYQAPGRTVPHDSVTRGAWLASPQWYFPDMDSRGPFTSSLVLMNPSATPARVTITLQFPDRAPASLNIALTAGERRELTLSDLSVPAGTTFGAIVNTADGVGIVTERTSSGATASGVWRRSALGAMQPGTQWLLPTSGALYVNETDLAILNVSDTTARVRIRMIAYNFECCDRSEAMVDVPARGSVHVPIGYNDPARTINVLSSGTMTIDSIANDSGKVGSIVVERTNYCVVAHTTRVLAPGIRTPRGSTVTIASPGASAPIAAVTQRPGVLPADVGPVNIAVAVGVCACATGTKNPRNESSPILLLMRITICELRCDSPHVEEDWAGLVDHVRSHGSELVVLPEMPFDRWFADRKTFDAQVWNASVQVHDRWLTRLAELSPATVIATRPKNDHDQRVNEAFAWSSRDGLLPLHTKAYLPDEEGCWEASWYHAGESAFQMHQLGDLKVGALICTELWAFNHAREYGRAGAHVIVVPRATGRSTTSKWKTGGQACAIVAGCYCVSSNRAGVPGGDFGGFGWMIDPDGEILATTSDSERFHTIDISLAQADRAKQTYPRYALP